MHGQKRMYFKEGFPTQRMSNHKKSISVLSIMQKSIKMRAESSRKEHLNEGGKDLNF